jgi:hypothetical protein
MIAALRAVFGDFGDTYQGRLSVAGVGAVDDIVVSVCTELAERPAAGLPQAERVVT